MRRIIVSLSFFSSPHPALTARESKNDQALNNWEKIHSAQYYSQLPRGRNSPASHRPLQYYEVGIICTHTRSFEEKKKASQAYPSLSLSLFFLHAVSYSKTACWPAYSIPSRVFLHTPKKKNHIRQYSPLEPVDVLKRIPVFRPFSPFLNKMGPTLTGAFACSDAFGEKCMSSFFLVPLDYWGTN